MNTKYHQYAPLILRLVVGYGFAAHGWAKIIRGPAGLEKLLTQTGIPLPHLSSLILPYIELLGGLAILLGIFTTIIATPLICTMVVAVITIHFKFGFSTVNTIGLTSTGPKFGPPGYEINLLYIAGLLSLMLTGAGVFSVDDWLIKRKSR
ncbi:MAG: DoxX family protein [Bacteroidota bacterium]